MEQSAQLVYVYQLCKNVLTMDTLISHLLFSITLAYTIHSLLQVTPFPSNPGLQVQVNLPFTVAVQSAFESQLLFPGTHSICADHEQ